MQISPNSTLEISKIFDTCKFTTFDTGYRWQSQDSVITIIATAQLHSTKSDLTFWVGLNPAHNMSEVSTGDDPQQLLQREVRVSAFPYVPRSAKKIIVF